MAEPAVYYLQEQLRLIRGFEKEVAELSESLDAVEDLLLEAEARQFFNGRSAIEWVDSLKELCYDVDGLLGQWCFHKQQAVDAKKVRFYVPSTWFRGSRGLVTASKIKELTRTVNEIANQKNRCSVNTTRFKVERIRTEPDIVAAVYGREIEKECLIDRLLSEVGDTIPIVGMVGIGKTALARLAYNDYKVKDHFGPRIWVHVGSSFDLIQVMKKIIESIEGSVPDLSELESLSRCVEKSLGEKKFLLVLDDVWTEDEMKWLQLKVSLRLGPVGSKIVVTTQRKQVAFMTGAENHVIQLGELSEESCWCVFSDKAFSGRSQEERARLEEAGRRITRRCKGLPLFAELLGSHLASQSEEQWEAVACHELWELDGEIQSIFTSFFQSYHELSALEKRCLAYCTIFPKDHEIDRADLIELWRAQGYLIGNGYIEIGENCSKSLVMQSIFQDCGQDFDGNITTYRMHGTMIDFLQFVVRKEFSVEKSSGIEEKVNQDHEITRHCTLLLESGAQIPIRICHKTSLRSLFVHRSEMSNPLNLSPLLQKLRSLRTFCLPRCCIEELPASIDKLTHLRYLNLTENSNIKELPNELCNLINLQTLRLTGCIGLQRLPEEIGKLLNLHHLYINGCHQLKELPKGIGRLTEIRILDMFVVPHDEAHYLSDRAMKLGDLNDLNLIQGQKIHIRECSNLHTEDAKKAQLRSKEYLAELQLSFSENALRETQEYGILAALEPHKNLTSLLISHYHSSVFPKWMSCVSFNLKRLRLSNCECEYLPPLGQLPWLVFLHIEGMGNVRALGLLFLGMLQFQIVSFPRLRELHFSELRNWEKWQWIHSRKEKYITSAIMPRLESLSIHSCPKLEALPGSLTEKMQGKTLDIKDCKMLQEFSPTKMEKSEGDRSKFAEKKLPEKTQILKDLKALEECNPEEMEKSKGNRSKFDKGKWLMFDKKKQKEQALLDKEHKMFLALYNQKVEKMGEVSDKISDLTQIVQYIWEHDFGNGLEDYKLRDSAELQRHEGIDYKSARFKSTIRKFERKRKEKWARQR